MKVTPDKVPSWNSAQPNPSLLRREQARPLDSAFVLSPVPAHACQAEQFATRSKMSVGTDRSCLHARRRVASPLLLPLGPEGLRTTAGSSPGLGARQHDRLAGRAIRPRRRDPERACARASPCCRAPAPAGAIPNNVDCATLRPNFRAYADGGLWWIIGSSLLAPDPKHRPPFSAGTSARTWTSAVCSACRRAPDWQDLFCTRGKGLYLNCLYVLALRAAAKLFEPTKRRLQRRDGRGQNQ